MSAVRKCDTPSVSLFVQPCPDDLGHFCSAEAAHAVIIMFSQLEVYRWPRNDRTTKQRWSQQSEQFCSLHLCNDRGIC